MMSFFWVLSPSMPPEQTFDRPFCAQQDETRLLAEELRPLTRLCFKESALALSFLALRVAASAKNPLVFRRSHTHGVW
jgi:hypothetical protein